MIALAISGLPEGGGARVARPSPAARARSRPARALVVVSTTASGARASGGRRARRVETRRSGGCRRPSTSSPTRARQRSRRRPSARAPTRRVEEWRTSPTVWQHAQHREASCPTKLPPRPDSALPCPLRRLATHVAGRATVGMRRLVDGDVHGARRVDGDASVPDSSSRSMAASASSRRLNPEVAHLAAARRAGGRTSDLIEMGRVAGFADDLDGERSQRKVETRAQGDTCASPCTRRRPLGRVQARVASPPAAVGAPRGRARGGRG